MELSEKIKKMLPALAVMHAFETLIAVRAARKRGEKPGKYLVLTPVFGVFVLVPLLRKPKLEDKSQAVDI